MTKSDSDILSRLAAHTRANPARSGRHNASFLAVKGDVVRGLDEGYPMMAVWGLLHAEGKLDMKYDSFRRYCRIAGLKRKRRPTKTKAGPPAPPGGFSHSATPNQSEIYGDDED